MAKLLTSGFSFITNCLIAISYLVGIVCQSFHPFAIYSQFTTSLSGRGGVSGQTPQSPCPQTFQYQSNGYEVFGAGQIQPGQYQIGADIVMMAHLIVGSQLASNYYGKIRLTGTPEEIVNKMYNNEPIPFEILFPTQDSLPSVSSILVNGNPICQGDQFSQPSGYYTRVALQYMFKPIVSPNFRPRPTNNFGSSGNNIFGNQGGFPVSVPQQNQFVPAQFPQTTEIVNVPQQPVTDSINLISNNNNFGFQVQPTTPTPQLPVPQSTRTQAPPIATQQSPPQSSYDIGCGKIPKHFTPLVYGGVTISKGDWPFIAALYHFAMGASSFKFKCGATIVSRTTIISAAHCFYNNGRRVGAENVLAFVGHFNLKRIKEEGSQIINLASVIIHPEYQKQAELSSDIAVGKLSESLVFTEFIQPACFWTGPSDQTLIVGRNGVIVGWGRDESGEQTDEPKRVEVPIVSDQLCLRSHDVFGKITSDRTFCAGWRNGSEGPCAGDSGSGLMLHQDGMWYLRGLVSVALKDSNTGQCDLNEFVVFTDVAKYMSWITTLL